MAEEQNTMRSKLADCLNNMQSMSELLPYMQHLLKVEDIKDQLLQQMDIENAKENNNDSCIRKLYFEIEPNYLFKSIPEQLILCKIFPYIIDEKRIVDGSDIWLKEMTKLAIINKSFHKMINQYHKLFSCAQYKILYYIPNLHDQKEEIKAKDSVDVYVDVSHPAKTVTVHYGEKYAENKSIKVPTTDEEFECVAIADYIAGMHDELDLKENKVYTIMQTSASGWWYAVDENREDGML